MAFGEWDVSSLQGKDQQVRLTRAREAKLTPLTIDKERKTGIFSGSHGTYEATLDSCQCVDFTRRKKPCKHMLRLAMELGLISENYESDISKIKCPVPKDSYNLSDAIDIIESLEVSTQQTLKEFLKLHLYVSHGNVGMKKSKDIAALLQANILENVIDNEILLQCYSRNELNDLIVPLNKVGFKRNWAYDKLVQWCLENINDDIPAICIDTVALTITNRFEKAKRKIYTYLSRKFDSETYINENMEETEIPKGSSYTASLNSDSTGISLELSFPDDEVTHLLDKHGANPFKNMISK